MAQKRRVYKRGSDECKDSKKTDLVKNARETYPYYSRVPSMLKQDLCAMKKKDCSRQQYALANDNNSCYLDSIIVGLFHNGNEYVRDLFLNSPIQQYPGSQSTTRIAEAIQTELQSIVAGLSSQSPLVKTQYCTDLRRLFQRYQSAYSDDVSELEEFDWKYAQAEPFDFVRFMQVVFDLKPNNRIRQELWGTNSQRRVVILKKLDKVSDRVERAGLVHMINLEDMLGADLVDLRKMLPMHRSETMFDAANMWKPNRNKEYTRKIEKTTYVQGHLLIVHIPRLAFQEKLSTSVVPPLKIKMKLNATPLYLRSIVVHHGDYDGGHYTCLYECKGVWYHYDDLRPNVRRVGSFSEVETFRDGYFLRNSTDLVYTM